MDSFKNLFGIFEILVAYRSQDGAGLHGSAQSAKLFLAWDELVVLVIILVPGSLRGDFRSLLLVMHFHLNRTGNEGVVRPEATETGDGIHHGA